MAVNFQVHKLYKSVVDDVISNVREAFLDDGVDDQVLQELKQLWENKLMSSKAVEALSDSGADRPPPSRQQTSRPQQQLRQQVTTSIGHQSGQVPVFAQIPGMSRAAAQATLALPPMYQQQFTAGSVFNTDQGTIILQTTPQSQLLTQSQISTQAHIQHRQLQPLTIQATSGGQTNQVTGAMIQLDGAADTAEDICAGPSTSHAAILSPPHLTPLATSPSPAPSTSSSAPSSSPLTPPSSSRLRPGPVYVEGVIQLDGAGDTSSEDDDEDDDDDNEDGEDEREEGDDGGVEEEPLNSEDDVSDDDPAELFDTENVIVCQYDKINRCKNKWKFHMKDGIMNLSGRDYVFQRAAGDAEW